MSESSDRRVQREKPTASELARDSRQVENGEHQVWHLGGYPSSRIAWMLGSFQPRFPDDYIHVANVRAESLAVAVELTTHGRAIQGDAAPFWNHNQGVKALVFAPRSTDVGDIVVDPAGGVHEVRRDGFARLEPAAIGAAEPARPPEALTPSEIARLHDAASIAREFLHGTAQEIDDARSGQLSPSHTPGRGGR